jgi:L-2-hydroxyglutarate oxidase
MVTTENNRYDYAIIGGGIVGLSTAWQLQQREPDKKILVLEKEYRFAMHQTGHNSGVIHAGIYYEPGSLKAKFCKEGVETTTRFCRENDIVFDQCGKLLVATNEPERIRMLALFERAMENGLDVELLEANALIKIEPNIIGVGAIFLKTTGIVDFKKICMKMAERFCALGGETRLNSEVLELHETAEAIQIKTSDGIDILADYLVSCSGLMADRITRMQGLDTDFQIIPFRGEYYKLPSSQNQIINHLIYPIPDPELPFLGVHLTRTIDGSVIVGPNAVQGWKREGYNKINISFGDIGEMFFFAGFWKVLRKHFRTGMRETFNSWWKPGYLKSVQKYCPSIQLRDLHPYPAGVRAQAVMKDGSLVHDFLFVESPRSLHVCNAPSPAATSAIPIGNYICDKVTELVEKNSQSKTSGNELL